MRSIEGKMPRGIKKEGCRCGVCGALGYAAVNFWRAKREEGTLLVVRDDKGQIIGCRRIGK